VGSDRFFIKVFNLITKLTFLDSIYICGGNDGNNILNSFESYDIKKEKWSTLANLH